MSWERDKREAEISYHCSNPEEEKVPKLIPDCEDYDESELNVDQEDFGDDLAKHLLPHVEVQWESGSFNYEHHGRPGVHTTYHPVVYPSQVIVDVSKFEVVPLKGEAEEDVSDGLRCGEAKYKIELQEVVRQDGKLLAVYDVEVK